MTDSKALRASLPALIGVSLARGLVGPGLNSSLGVFFPGVAEELGVGVGTLSLTVSLGALAGMLYLPLAARLFERRTTRVSVLTGAVLTCLPFAAQALGRGVLWWFLLSVPFGMGTVLLVNLLGPLALGRDSSATGGALGLMMTLSGLSAAVVQPLIAGLVSRVGWRNAYLAGGGGTFLFLLGCTLCFPRGEHLTAPAPAADDPGRGKTEERPLLFTLGLFLAAISAFNAFHQHFATCGAALGLTAGQVGHALFLSMLGAAAGGLLLGAVSRRWGAVTGGLTALAVGMTALVLFFCGAAHSGVFYAASVLHGVTSSSIGITAQAVAREHFHENYGRILAGLLRAVPLATVVSVPLFGTLYDRFGTYRPTWVILLCLLGASALFLFFSTRRRRNVSRSSLTF